MWNYAFTISGNKATRNEKSPGFLPIANTQQIKANGISTVSIRAKVTKGEVRLGITAKANILMDSWSRTKFIYLDGNMSRLGKHSAVSYNNKQISPDL